MENGFIIETEDFAGGQLQFSNAPKVLEVLSYYMGDGGALVRYDRNGDINEILRSNGEEFMKVGEYFSLTKNGAQRHASADAILAAYEELNGGEIPGDSWEEKAKEIAFGEFWNGFLESDDSMAEEPEGGWEFINSPFGYDEENLRMRAKRGYGDKDWWNFNYYIAGVIASAAEKYKNDSHGFPPVEVNGEFNAEVGEKQWAEKMDIISEGFRHYVENDFELSKAKVDAALETFKEVFYDLWD